MIQDRISRERGLHCCTKTMLTDNTPAKLHMSENNYFIAGSFKSQHIDYFRGHIVFWEQVEGNIWHFYDNEVCFTKK